MLQQTNYEGPERRRHRIYVTRNTEYHLRDGVCVAVRDRRSGSFNPRHEALNRRVRGGVRLQANGVLVPCHLEPEPGDALLFADDERDLVTSAIHSIERPPKPTALAYDDGGTAAFAG
jgi:hypothetical protein